MKSLIALQQLVLRELGTRCGTSTTLDRKTIERRVEHEGLSFLTITLPSFATDLEKGLSQGMVDHTMFLSFSKHRGLPRFLGGFLDRVFDRDSGLLLEHPCIDSIRAIRQITLMFGKLEVSCSEKRIQAAISRYVQCEQDVKHFDLLLLSEPDRLQRYSRIGRLLWADYFSKVDSRIYNDSVVPKHGPGSTADKLRGNAKYNQFTWTRRLESLFPHWEHLIPSESLIEMTDGVNILEPGQEMPVKVITVPKTLKTPRIIAIEPTCMQYMQQGVLSVMVDQIVGSANPAHLIDFEFQEPNQRLAEEGSFTGAFATLDLSEASDRVSNQHVRLLLANHKWLNAAVDATRSRKADVFGQTLRLAKFASMGSALCFPFESLVFMTVIFCGIERELRRPLTQKDVESFYGRVRVYGDDIIVPVEYVQSVVEELEAFGFRVNANKSFWTGKFRESCGSEWYDGHDVTVVRCRTHLPSNRQHVRELEATVNLRNALFERGFQESVAFLDERIERIIPFPVVRPTSILLGRHDYHLPSQYDGHDPHLHHPLARGAVVVSKSPVSQLDGYGALMKFFLSAEGRSRSWIYPSTVDKDHLFRAGRPDSAHIKIRKARPW